MDNNDAREKLIQAATPLFAKKGLSGVSIREVAQAAEVNSSLISYYFGGKEMLYKAVLEEQFAVINLLLAEIQTQRLELPEAVKLYGSTVGKVHEARPYLLRFLHSELTNPTECLETVIKPRVMKVFAFLAGVLQAADTQGQLRSGIEPSAALFSLAGMINFFFISRPLSRLFLPDSPDYNEKFISQAVDIFLNGIRRHDDE